jgi:hypothetical protein
LLLAVPEDMAPRKVEKVIAHFRDGTLLRGTTRNFNPIRASMRMKTEDGKRREVDIRELKALFFVKEFAGNPSYKERKGFFTASEEANKVLVEFADGEVIFGYSNSDSQRGLGFFLVPGDPDSNNIRVFVVRASTKRVKVKPVGEGDDAISQEPETASVDP